MQVDDATRIVIQELGRDDLSEVCEERPLGTDGRDSFNLRCITHLGGVYNTQSGTTRPRVDWCRRERTASAGGTWRSGHDGDDVEAGVRCNGAERRDRESATAK
jgi:hypothetical protein